VLNEGDFLGWCRRLALAETTQSAIAEVRSRNPTRRVGGGRDNVSGRYPSRKMGLTIQFESHRVELPLVYEMEHDPGVLEYYDQPPSIPLAYHAEESQRLLTEFVDTDYENLKQKTMVASWAALKRKCDDHGVVTPSYVTLCAAVRTRPFSNKRSSGKVGALPIPTHLSISSWSRLRHAMETAPSRSATSTTPNWMLKSSAPTQAAHSGDLG
jgi:hypothetical protein